MEIAGELWTPPYILDQEGNSFLQLLSPVCVGLKAEVHIPKAAIQNVNCFSMRLRSDGPLKGCDHPGSHLNRKECATATGLQTWYQLPMQKERGRKIFISLCKREVKGVLGAVVRTEERTEGLLFLPTKQHF